MNAKSISVAVCDDELRTLDIIMASVKECFLTHGVHAGVDGYKNPADLWAALKKQSYNLLFLDINMAGMDGIALGKKIVETNNRPDIIFVSSNTDRVFETFEVNPFGFVRKSNFLTDISSVIDRYVAKKSEDGQALLQFGLKSDGGIVTLNVKNLKYVECMRNEQIFYMDKQDACTIRSRMETLEKQLSTFDFLRIHKGYLVNCAYIKRFDTNCITLTTGEVLPIGRSKHTEFMEKYLEYIHKNGISIIG